MSLKFIHIKLAGLYREFPYFLGSSVICISPTLPRHICMNPGKTIPYSAIDNRIFFPFAENIRKLHPGSCIFVRVRIPYHTKANFESRNRKQDCMRLVLYPQTRSNPCVSFFVNNGIHSGLFCRSASMVIIMFPREDLNPSIIAWC